MVVFDAGFLVFLGLVALGAAFGFFVYFIPAIVAFWRSANSALAIFVCNLLFGWTFLGWGICLVWAFAADNRRMMMYRR